MTGPRLPSVRRVNCGFCKKSFIPRRKGMLFCSEAHQRAETRRQLKAMAEALFEPSPDFKTVLSIARATSRRRDWYAQWTAYGTYREEWCRGVALALARFKGVRFVGTVLGVFAVEDRPGAIQAILDAPWRDIFEVAAKDWRVREAFDGAAHVVECSVDDPRLIKAILPPLVGGGWQDRKQDAKYRALLLDNVSRVILFSVKFPETKTVTASKDEVDASLIFSGTSYSIE
jgi:hypothetical protein